MFMVKFFLDLLTVEEQDLRSGSVEYEYVCGKSCRYHTGCFLLWKRGISISISYRFLIQVRNENNI
jgi:hypothetical protein